MYCLEIDLEPTLEALGSSIWCWEAGCHDSGDEATAALRACATALRYEEDAKAPLVSVEHLERGGLDAHHVPSPQPDAGCRGWQLAQNYRPGRGAFRPRKNRSPCRFGGSSNDVADLWWQSEPTWPLDDDLNVRRLELDPTTVARYAFRNIDLRRAFRYRTRAPRSAAAGLQALGA